MASLDIADGSPVQPSKGSETIPDRTATDPDQAQAHPAGDSEPALATASTTTVSTGATAVARDQQDTDAKEQAAEAAAKTRGRRAALAKARHVRRRSHYSGVHLADPAPSETQKVAEFLTDTDLLQRLNEVHNTPLSVSGMDSFSDSSDSDDFLFRSMKRSPGRVPTFEVDPSKRRVTATDAVLERSVIHESLTEQVQRQRHPTVGGQPHHRSRSRSRSRGARRSRGSSSDIAPAPAPAQYRHGRPPSGSDAMQDKPLRRHFSGVPQLTVGPLGQETVATGAVPRPAIIVKSHTALSSELEVDNYSNGEEPADIEHPEEELSSSPLVHRAFGSDQDELQMLRAERKAWRTKEAALTRRLTEAEAKLELYEQYRYEAKIVELQAEVRRAAETRGKLETKWRRQQRRMAERIQGLEWTVKDLRSQHENDQQDLQSYMKQLMTMRKAVVRANARSLRQSRGSVRDQSSHDANNGNGQYATLRRYSPERRSSTRTVTPSRSATRPIVALHTLQEDLRVLSRSVGATQSPSLQRHVGNMVRIATEQPALLKRLIARHRTWEQGSDSDSDSDGDADAAGGDG